MRRLDETDTHDGGWELAIAPLVKLTLGVVAVAETVAETGSDSHNVLEGAAERDARDVVDQLDAELGGLCCSSATPYI